MFEKTKDINQDKQNVLALLMLKNVTLAVRHTFCLTSRVSNDAILELIQAVEN